MSEESGKGRDLIPNLTAVILAGGEGTRLREVTDLPKPIAPVLGKPFLFYLLEALRVGGVSRTIISAGYRAEKVIEAVKSSKPGLEPSFSIELDALGTGGALRLACTQIEGDPIVVLNGDSFCDFELGPFLEFHQKQPRQVSLLATHVENAGRYGRLDFGEDGRVTRFVEKDSSAQDGWINAGVYLIPATKLRQLPEITPLSLERQVFPRWMGDGIYAFAVQAPFLDIGTPESYEERDEFMKGVIDRRRG